MVTIHTYIMSFKELYAFDDDDDFKNPYMIKLIQNDIDDCYFDKVEPTKQEMANLVRNALHTIQYGDTYDNDILTGINKHFQNRFPNGR